MGGKTDCCCCVRAKQRFEVGLTQPGGVPEKAPSEVSKPITDAGFEGDAVSHSYCKYDVIINRAVELLSAAFWRAFWTSRGEGQVFRSPHRSNPVSGCDVVSVITVISMVIMLLDSPICEYFY